MSQRRSVTMGVLIALPIVLLGTTFLALPYKAQVEFLDRKRGIVHREIHYFSFIQLQDGPTSIELSAFGPTTAPDERLWVSSITYRFCWSSEYVIKSDEQNGQRQWVLYAIFMPTSQLKNGKPIFTSEESSRIIADRLPLWNSSRVDREPEVVRKELDVENKALVHSRMAELNVVLAK